MPKLVFARPPQDAAEERQLRKLATSRHAPGDWIRRAGMIVRSGDGLRPTAIAVALGCHPQTVRERIARCTVAGRDGRGDRPGPGRTPRLTETARGAIIAVAGSMPPGTLTRQPDGTLAARDEGSPAHWTLETLTAAAHARGIVVARSQVRRILLRAGVSWRTPHSWAASADPDVVPRERKSSDSTPTHRAGRRSAALTRGDRCAHGPSRPRQRGRRTGTAARRRWHTAADRRRFGGMECCGCGMARW